MHEPWIVFVTLAVTLGLFIWGYWRYDVVAMIAMLVLVASKAVPVDMAFSGFGNPAVITVACVMIMTAAISQSGVVDYLVKQLTPVTQHAVLHVALLTIVAAVLSAFMNNIGALALMMPIAIQTAVNANRSPAMVLMPLSFGSVLGGMTTSIGTPPNLLISAYREELTGHQFAMFDFSPVGVVVAVSSILFIALIGWRLLPFDRKVPSQGDDLFHLKDYITEIQIPENSPCVDKTVKELESLIDADYTIIGFLRGKKRRLAIPDDEILQAKDILLVEASHEDLEKLVNEGKFEIAGGEEISSELLKSGNISTMEAVVAPSSRMEGRSWQRMRIRSRYRINLLAIARQGRPYHQRLNHVNLRPGDVVLVQGNAETLSETISMLGLLPLVERGVSVGVPRRALLPILIFAISITVSALQLLAVQVSFAMGVVALVMVNVIPARDIYKNVDWSIIVLLAAMIPVGGALQSTGGTELIAQFFLKITGNAPHYVIFGLLLIITMTLSDIMNNAATAVVMSPIAVGIAHAMQASIDPFLMTVAIGASCSFLTPISHQNNTLVMGPGGYKFSDYWRLGLPVEIIVVLVGLPMILWVWPI